MKKRVVKERNNFWMYLVIILLLILIGFGLIYFRLTGNVIYNEGDYSSTDFAPPFDVFDGNKLIFTVSPENVAMTDVNNLRLNISVNQAGGFIYNKAYYYNTNISDWVEFTFPQATVGNSSWIASSATANINVPSNSLNNGNNLIATYSCKKYSGFWECGCQNTNESNCARWMLQIVNVSVEGACTLDSDCPSSNICIVGKCKNSTWKVQENGNFYSTINNYLYINYTTPKNALSYSVWKVRHGIYPAYNITLPSSCWSLDTLVLRFISTANNGAGKSYSRPECFNGTNWTLVGNVSMGSHDPAESTPCYGSSFIYDNNYSTYAVYGYANPSSPYACPDGWRFSPRAGYGYGGHGRLYEESMIWHLVACQNNSDCNGNICIDSRCTDRCSSDAECYQAYGANNYCSSSSGKCELMSICNASSKIGDTCSGGIMINSTRVWNYKPLVYCPTPLRSTNSASAKNYCDNLICGGYHNWTLPPVATFTDKGNYWTDWGLACTSSGFCSSSVGDVADTWCMKYL